eukprot:scaffold36470_cov79-Phaeocystis_antarctica.AAC.3
MNNLPLVDPSAAFTGCAFVASLACRLATSLGKADKVGSSTSTCAATFANQQAIAKDEEAGVVFPAGIFRRKEARRGIGVAHRHARLGHTPLAFACLVLSAEVFCGLPHARPGLTRQGAHSSTTAWLIKVMCATVLRDVLPCAPTCAEVRRPHSGDVKGAGSFAAGTASQLGFGAEALSVRLALCRRLRVVRASPVTDDGHIEPAQSPATDRKAARANRPARHLLTAPAPHTWPRDRLAAPNRRAGCGLGSALARLVARRLAVGAAWVGNAPGLGSCA